jgi:hypothetical protein
VLVYLVYHDSVVLHEQQHFEVRIADHKHRVLATSSSASLSMSRPKSLSVTVLTEGTVRKIDCSVSPLPWGAVKLTVREASGVSILLLNKDTGMDGGSGNVGCEGMSIDGDESVGMGTEVEDDDSKEGMVIGDECKDGTVTVIGGAEGEVTDIGTVKGLGVDYEVNPLVYGQ